MLGAIADHYVASGGGGGGITYVGGGSNRGAGTGASATVAYPAGLQAGDFMLLVAARVETSDTPPTGWTRVGTVQSGSGGSFATRATAYSRVATSGDVGGSVSHASSGNVLALSLVVYRGASGINTNTQAGSGSASTTLTAPAATTTVDGCQVVRLFGTYDGTHTHSVDAPATHRTAVPSGSNAATSAGDSAQATAGATGTNAATSTASTSWAAFTVALAP